MKMFGKKIFKEKIFKGRIRTNKNKQNHGSTFIINCRSNCFSYYADY